MDVYVDKIKEEGVKKCFFHAQGIKMSTQGEEGGAIKWQNYVHSVVECPLILFCLILDQIKVEKLSK